MTSLLTTLLALVFPVDLCRLGRSSTQYRERERGRPLRRPVKRQNVTGLNFFLVEFLLPAEILFSGRVRS